METEFELQELAEKNGKIIRGCIVVYDFTNSIIYLVVGRKVYVEVCCNIADSGDDIITFYRGWREYFKSYIVPFFEYLEFCMPEDEEFTQKYVEAEMRYNRYQSSNYTMHIPF